jgi:hypothetical protein
MAKLNVGVGLCLAGALALANVQLEPGVLAPVVAKCTVGWIELCQVIYDRPEPIYTLALSEGREGFSLRTFTLVKADDPINRLRNAASVNGDELLRESR